MMRIILLVIVGLICIYSCDTAKSTTSFVTDSQYQLPPKPDPNKCYVRSVLPPIYTKQEVRYLTYTEADAQLFPHKQEAVILKPASRDWVYKQDKNCTAPNPEDCRILCLEEIPAEIAVIFTPIDSTQGNPMAKVFQISKLEREGGQFEWKEVECGAARKQ